MDEVIYSASGPPSYMVSMDEVIYSAPWRPWQKSAIVPAALSYLSFPAASRWTKTVPPNLWLRRTRGICCAEPGVLAGVGRRLLVAEHVALVLQHREGGGRAIGGISVPLDCRI